MGIPNKLLLAQVTFYVTSFILSFFMFVPVSVNLGDFNGHCLLFATGNWTPNTGVATELRIIDWGPDGACNFTIFTGIVSMLESVIYFMWYSIFLLKDTDSFWVDAATSAILSFILLIFSFASALTVSTGFTEWCNLVTSPAGNIYSCEDGDFIPFGQAMAVETAHFYTEFQIAQFGCWSMWVCQLILFVLGVMKLYRYHRQEDFLTSLSRERQRLLQRVQGQPGNDFVKT